MHINKKFNVCVCLCMRIYRLASRYLYAYVSKIISAYGFGEDLNFYHELDLNKFPSSSIEMKFP
jgi:hypothetical protein